VAIHPDRYGELSYERPRRTAGLWWGEGVTLYYADILPRRAGLADSSESRLDRLAALLTSYYAAPWRTSISPERASLAFEDSPVANPDATGGYYLQGELLGEALDALVRDSTHDARGIDAIMRALFERSGRGDGFTGASLEALTDSVCGCRSAGLFATQVRGNALIDMRAVVARLGLDVIVDTVSAVDSAGVPLPDLRVGIDFMRRDPPLRLVVNHPASAWSVAGLRTGDVLVTFADHPIGNFGAFQGALRALRIGDTAVVDIQRDGAPLRVHVPVVGYTRPRVRFRDAPAVTADQRARRVRWLAGW
jgi:predicted metalloprotease with PDZ domain